MKDRKAVWPWVVVGVAVVGGAGWWLFRDNLPPAPGASPFAAQAPAGESRIEPPAAAPEAQPAQTPQHPLERDDSADAGLPALGDSDATAQQALASLFASDVLALLRQDHLVQRLVMHIDNLTQPVMPSNALAARPLSGSLKVEGDAASGGVRIAAANAARYAPWVKAFTAVDADALVAAYLRLYPLVQEAWREAGHPDGHFNDRLVAVIDHLLQAPEPARPLEVELDERGRYRFVDPGLQSRSVGQKLLLRLDAEQSRAVRQQLRAIRAAVTRGG